MTTQPIPNQPRSHIIHETCKYCGKILELESSKVGKNSITKLFKCGHTIIVPGAEAKKAVTFDDGIVPYNFQVDSLRFLEKANFRGLLNLEMGLGKTIITLLALKTHPELLPAMIVCKSSIKIQWFIEAMEKIGEIAQILKSSKDVPRLPLVIFSVDLLSRSPRWLERDENGNTMHDGYKTIIIDECQTIKNHDAARTNGLRDLVLGKKHVIALSGTPIKNNAGEYFPILNILHPEIFPYREPFIRDWCDWYQDSYSTKLGGIKPYRLKEFKQLTSPFIIRYTRDEVLPDLPKIDRQVKFIDIENDVVRKAYAKALDEFLDDFEEQDKLTAASLASLQKMRHIVGLAKVNPTVDLVEDFMFSDEEMKSKIVVFVHHKNVGELLMKKLEAFNPLQFTADLSSERRYETIEQFKKPEHRILIASTLAAGEGINLQFCNACVIMERQWNPANEEQAEARFPRPGSTADKILVMYPTVTGSIDEMLVSIVGRKRVAINQTLSGDGSIPWDSDNILRELAEELRRKGRKGWK